ncbi:MAG: apolipoprotein N-acyltransferase [Verrucomicrobiota bacterium]
MSGTTKKLISTWPWLAAILTGLLYTGCLAPFNQTWLCWVALTPLIIAIWFSGMNSRRRWLRNLSLGYVAGIVFFTGAFSWLGALGDLYKDFWLHGLSFLLSFYLGLYFAFWSWFIGLIMPRDFLSSRRNMQIAFLGASAWVAQEWIRGWLFTGFSWNGLGVALHDTWAIIQIAEFTGVIGLSFVVAFGNIIVVLTPVRLFLEARAHQMRPHFDVTLTLAGLVALCTFGIFAVQNQPPSKPLRVAAVQADIPQVEKFNPQFSRKIFDRFERLSDVALHSGPRPDLLIWPEASMPGVVREPTTEDHLFVTNLSASSKIDLLLGAVDVEAQQDYNAAILVSGVTQQMQIYRKMHLVPFGEYIPLRHSFPPFAAIASSWVPGDFATGKDFTVFALTNGDVRAAPLVCFEDTDGDLTRRFVLNGANLLVNVTNDGWFLRSAGSRQHLDNAIFRCIETRRPMVRAANTGVTCFVNEFGRITQILQDETGNAFTEGVLAGEVNVPQDRQLTFYVRHGELFAQICTGITLLTLLFLIGVRSRRRRPNIENADLLSNSAGGYGAESADAPHE